MKVRGFRSGISFLMLALALGMSGLYEGCQKKGAGVAASSQASAIKLRTDSSGFVEPVWPAKAKPANITFWTWITNSDKLAAAFSKAYPDIKVDLPKVPNGQGEYTKLATALQAGSGAPDVVQIEFQALPQFVNTGGLADISAYAAVYKPLYPEWAWSQVNIGGKLYAIPQDIGPMGLMYRKDLFDKYNIAVPKTWADFAQAAAALKAKDPSAYITFFPVNDNGWFTGILWQGGAFPFKDTPRGWKIDFTSEAALKVVTYWDDLIKKGYVQVATDWSPEWTHDVAVGKYATILGAAWSPTYELEPYVKDPSQQWRVAETPQWNPAQPTNGNWGGSTDAVTTQSSNKDAAALFAAWINLSKPGVEICANDISQGGSGLFTADSSSEKLGPFLAANAFLGGQQANLVFSKMVPWVDKSYEWSPWTSYVYNEMTVEFTKLFKGEESVAQALGNIQQQVTNFAKVQGFQVAQ